MSDEKGLSRREFFSFFRRVPEPRRQPQPAPGPPAPPKRQLAYAVVDWQRCVTYKEQPCDLCVRACPVERVMSSDNHGHPQVDFDRCTGCGACEAACPVKPAAIGLYSPP